MVIDGLLIEVRILLKKLERASDKDAILILKNIL